MQDRWVTVQFENVCGWVPKSFKPPGMLPKFGIQSKPDKEKDLRQILFGLTGVYRLGAPVQLLVLQCPNPEPSMYMQALATLAQCWPSW